MLHAQQCGSRTAPAARAFAVCVLTSGSGPAKVGAACLAVNDQAARLPVKVCALPSHAAHAGDHGTDMCCLCLPADSLVAKFNLVCADAWKVQFANSVSTVLQPASCAGPLLDPAPVSTGRSLALLQASLSKHQRPVQNNTASVCAPCAWGFAKQHELTLGLAAALSCS